MDEMQRQMGLASKVEDMKALDAEARKRELEELVAKQVGPWLIPVLIHIIFLNLYLYSISCIIFHIT